MPRTGRPAARITLSDSERETLQRWARRPSSAQAQALRSRIVLTSAEGRTDREVAAQLRVNPVTVSSGGTVLPLTAWRGSLTPPGRARREPSATTS